jgi:hypothetical protein
VKAEEKPLFSFQLTEEWGILDVDGEEKTNDFEIYAGKTFTVQTTPYWTKSSIRICKVEVYEKYIKFTWKLADGAHEEFKTGEICNKNHSEFTPIEIENSGEVWIPYYEGLNDYDAYFYTGQTVGIIEFDLFDVLILYVEE